MVKSFEDSALPATCYWKMKLFLQHVQAQQVLYLATDEVQTVEVFRKARLRPLRGACSRMFGACVGEGIAAWKPGQWHCSLLAAQAP